MNKVILIGNLTKDPEMRTTPNGTNVTSFTVACTRKFKNQNGEYETDFINCIAWRQTGEFIKRYFTKGRKIAVTGTIQTRTYNDKEGVKRYVTEVVVDEAEFVTPKGDSNGSGYSAPANNGYSNGNGYNNSYNNNNGGYSNNVTSFNAPAPQPAPMPAPAPVPTGDASGFEDFDIQDAEIPF